MYVGFYNHIERLGAHWSHGFKLTQPSACTTVCWGLGQPEDVDPRGRFGKVSKHEPRTHGRFQFYAYMKYIYIQSYPQKDEHTHKSLLK